MYFFRNVRISGSRILSAPGFSNLWISFMSSPFVTNGSITWKKSSRSFLGIFEKTPLLSKAFNFASKVEQDTKSAFSVVLGIISCQASVYFSDSGSDCGEKKTSLSESDSSEGWTTREVEVPPPEDRDFLLLPHSQLERALTSFTLFLVSFLSPWSSKHILPIHSHFFYQMSKFPDSNEWSWLLSLPDRASLSLKDTPSSIEGLPSLNDLGDHWALWTSFYESIVLCSRS